MSYPRKDSSESSQELAPEYTDKPPIDDDQQPEYADEPLHEYEGEAPSEGSRIQKVCKTICVTTSSALMVIAGAFVMFLFNLMSAYWLLSTWPLFHIGWQALSVVYYSMSASFLIVLLLYPWLALAGDVRFGNSRLLLAGVIPLHVLGLAISGVWIGIYFAFLDHSAVIQYFMVLGFFVLFLSIGVFETNALQYGRDVLGDVNSPELSAFIHWYYWATRLPTFLVGITTINIFGIFFL